MPELPEVEIVVRQLKKVILGKIIKRIIFHREKILKNGSSRDFNNKITSQTIIDIKRRGKNIIIYLNDYVLLFHLRMEGKFFYAGPVNNIINTHYMITFNFSDNTFLNYHDTRRFGTLFWYNKFFFLNSKNQTIISKIGPEPWDNKLNAKYFYSKIKNKKVAIKSILLDQSIIAGIGNIYANEILFLSNINPTKRATLLSTKEIKLIINNTRIILKKAILMGGTTIATFFHGDGISGKFQNELNVHGKQGKKCIKCNKALILKIWISQRGTYFCPNCQK